MTRTARTAWLAAALAMALAASSASAQTFRHHRRWFQVGPNPSAIVAHDLSGDGRPEIVTADTGRMACPRSERPANDELSLLTADKPLEYTKQVALRTGFGPYCMTVANIDALPAPDLVVGCFHAVPRRDEFKHVTLFRNLSELLFESVHYTIPVDPLPYTRARDGDDQPIFTKPGLVSLIVHDFNANGYRDLLAAGWASDTLVFMPGHPGTYFGDPVLISAPGGPRDVRAADLDGDGRLDLVTTMYASGEIVIWKGDGAGGFAETERFLSRGDVPHKVRIADMNRDGRPDLVVSHCHASDSVVVFFGEGGLQFAMSQEIALGKSRTVLEHEIRDLLVEDLDGDGRPDIALACSASSQVVILFNTTEAKAHPLTFRQETYAFEDGQRKGRPRALCAADFNEDGKKDLAVALWDADAVALLLAR